MRRFTTRSARVRAERRLRRATRSVIAAVTTIGAAAALAVTGLPAVATTTAPAITLHVMGGDRQITAAWNAVASATGYTVHWGLGTSTANVLHTTGTSIRINGVTDFKAYSVRVTADRTTAASARLTATPTSYAPLPITSVKAVPAGPNQITVSWTGGGRARSFAVYVGSDSQTKDHHYATAWHPAALSSWTLTLPPSIRGVLGAGSGNPIFVRVVQTNSTASYPRMEWYYNGTTKFRLSTVGPWTVAGAAKPATDPSALTVASWNAQAVSVTAGYSPGNRWAARLPKVVANLENLHPDVVGFQELGTSRLVQGCANTRINQGIYDCVEQYQSLATAMQSQAIPYRTALTDENVRVYQQAAAGNPKNIVDSSIFYNPAKVDLLEAGYLSPREFMGADLPSTYEDEQGVWAVFRTTDASAREFLMASIHMPAGGTNIGAVRRAEAADLAKRLDAMSTARGGIPVVVTGDFNGDGVTDPDAANLRFVADGYSDAAGTTHRSSPQWCTDNLTNGPDGADPGYPVHAVPHAHWASRIDYIMLKGAVSASYTNALRLTSGVFDTRYQGSDHNMQLSTIHFVATS